MTNKRFLNLESIESQSDIFSVSCIYRPIIQKLGDIAYRQNLYSYNRNNYVQSHL